MSGYNRITVFTRRIHYLTLSLISYGSEQLTWQKWNIWSLCVSYGKTPLTASDITNHQSSWSNTSVVYYQLKAGDRQDVFRPTVQHADRFQQRETGNLHILLQKWPIDESFVSGAKCICNSWVWMQKQTIDWQLNPGSVWQRVLGGVDSDKLRRWESLIDEAQRSILSGWMVFWRRAAPLASRGHQSLF